MKMSSRKSSDDWVTPPSTPKRKTVKFSKPTSSTESSHGGTSQTPTAGNPDAPATEIKIFSVLGEKAPPHSRNPVEAKGRSIQGRKPQDPTFPVETTRASPLPGHQDVPPNPQKKEGEVTSSDADIHDGIAKALLDDLQEKWIGNELRSTMISIARVRASQLQQCLIAGRETSAGTTKATLDLISLEQEPSGLTNLAGKVSAVNHTLECISNQPSTAVPA